MTERLPRLRAGDEILFAPRPAGYLVLSEVPQAEQLWMLATGTAIGPFLSILQDEAIWRRFPEIVLAHAVRRAEELSYAERIRGLVERGGGRLRFAPFVTREETPGAFTGRIPAALASGSLSEWAGIAAFAGKVAIYGVRQSEDGGGHIRHIKRDGISRAIAAGRRDILRSRIIGDLDCGVAVTLFWISRFRGKGKQLKISLPNPSPAKAGVQTGRMPRIQKKRESTTNNLSISNPAQDISNIKRAWHLCDKSAIAAKNCVFWETLWADAGGRGAIRLRGARSNLYNRGRKGGKSRRIFRRRCQFTKSEQKEEK